AIATVDVCLVGGLARDRDEESAVHVERALRPSRRARRVREQVRMLRIELERGKNARLTRHLLGPARLPAPDDLLGADDVRLAKDLEHLDALAAPVGPVRRDPGLRARVLEA